MLSSNVAECQNNHDHGNTQQQDQATASTTGQYIIAPKPPTKPPLPGTMGDSLMEPFSITVKPSGITLADVTNQTPGEPPCCTLGMK